MTAVQQANVLITYYEQLFKNKYDTKPQINRNKVRWGFRDMIDDLGMTRAREVIAFYFTTDTFSHPTQYLLYNYDKLAEVKQELDDDAVARARIRAETKKRVEEWRPQSQR